MQTKETNNVVSSFNTKISKHLEQKWFKNCTLYKYQIHGSMQCLITENSKNHGS